VQRIYMLLTEHPEGMTRDEVHAELKDGWLDTDAYRAYEQHIIKGRKSLHQGGRGGEIGYGSDKFKLRAQRWWIASRLAHMKQCSTARSDGDRGHKRWFAGRPPRILTSTFHARSMYAFLDVTAKQADDRADTDAHIRREMVKARLLEDLNARYQGKSAVRDHLLETIRIAYDHLCGR
jgi:hypothetical protein